MPPKTNVPTMKQLQEQNFNMQKEMEKLKSDFCSLQESLKAHETAASNGGQSPEKETLASLEFMGQEYDDLNTFRTKTKKDLAALNSRLQSLYDRVDEMSIVLDEIINYTV